MKIQHFIQIGKRSNNEDYLGMNDNVIIVCDGIGGHTAGEYASKFIVENLLNTFVNRDNELTKNTIQQKLKEAQTELNKVLNERPELLKMGTTFTGLFKTDFAYYAAHIGDSRIYFIRPSEQKVWHTWDHSFVGELIKMNEITREDGRFHSMNNRISRAITANTENKTAQADIVRINDIKKGDIFFLCTDGIVEAWGDHDLIDVLSDNTMSIEQKNEILSARCNELSRDNNTAYIIEIEENDELNYGKNEEINWITFADIKENYQQYLKKEKDYQEKEQEENLKKQPIVAENNNKTQQNHTPITTPLDNTEPKEHKKINVLRISLLIIFTLLILFAVYKIVKSSFFETDTKETNILNDTNTLEHGNMPKINYDSLELISFKAAVEKNDFETYEDFLRSAHNIDYKNEINERLIWLFAKKENTKEMFETYKAKFANGLFTDSANYKLNELEILNLKNTAEKNRNQPNVKVKQDSIPRTENKEDKKEKEKEDVNESINEAEIK